MHATGIGVLRGRGHVRLGLRSRFERIFFGMVLFAAINLSLYGAYLLKEALRDPLGSAELSVVVAGFLLALASFLLTYLTWPRLKSAFERDEDSDQGEEQSIGPVLTVYGEAVQKRLEAERTLGEKKDLPGPM
jgi:membrane protein implicated in regulation of membrane protease activity